MTDARKALIAFGVVLLVGIGGGLGIGWKLWSPKPAKTETPAPAVKQPDGSQILERNPMAPAEAAKRVPLPMIPRGGTVERQVEVVVQPTQPAEPLRPSASDASAPVEPARPPCPPVRVDLALVKMPDESLRVIASSPDGQVVGGVDIPIAPVPQVKVLRWAAGGVYGITTDGKAIGAFVDRDLAFLRAGVEVTRATYTLPQRTGWELRGKIGIRF